MTGALVGIPLLSRISPFLAPTNRRLREEWRISTQRSTSRLGFLPLLGPFAKLLKRLIPTRIEPGDLSQPLDLAPSAISNPPVALGSAAREILRMADVLETMVRATVEALDGGDRGRIGETKQLDNSQNALTSAVRALLSGIDIEAMNESDESRLGAILTFAMNLEHAWRHLGSNHDVNCLATVKPRASFFGGRSEPDKKCTDAP